MHVHEVYAHEVYTKQNGRFLGFSRRTGGQNLRRQAAIADVIRRSTLGILNILIEASPVRRFFTFTSSRTCDKDLFRPILSLNSCAINRKYVQELVHEFL
jgi:hypothetical protein